MANIITITGALGCAPGLNFTNSGQAAWGFSLAYTPSRKTDNGWEDSGPTLWFDVTTWGADAEDLANRYSGVERGRATVTGRIGSRTWTNKDGVEQTQMTITADAVTIHPPKQQQNNGYSQGGWNNQQPTQQQPRPQVAKEPTYQPGPGGPRQEADPEPTRSSGGWAGAPSYDEPPF